MPGDNQDDYPLNCIDDTGDGFSGWFAISSAKKCNDFCYWDHLPNNNSSYAAWNTASPHQSTVIHTPMGTAYWTCVYDSADDKTMVSEATGERWIESWHKYSSSRRDHNDVQQHDDDSNINSVPFPYLRCQKGAGERLKTWSGEVVRSATFWESWIVIASLIYVGEIAGLGLLYKRGRLRKLLRYYEQVGVGPETFNEADEGGFVNDGQSSSLQIDGAVVEEDDDWDSNSNGMPNENENHLNEGAEGPSFLSRFSFNQPPLHLNSNNHAISAPRCKYCTPITTILCRDNANNKTQRILYILRVLLVIVLNLLLAFTISFSSISLMEIHHNPRFTEGMQKLTPACADPNLVCPAGNVDIERESAQWPPLESARGRREEVIMQRSEAKGHKEVFHNATKTRVGKELLLTPTSSDHATMQPFSYIVASDAQLYWFNGEFAEMGEQNIPSSCSPSDSCGRCTGKHGLNTNKQLKKAWENLMTGVNASSDLPVPSTLVMNGDLTAYFHPYEKHAYDSIYSNIDGLKYYFPSLGNHDIEHPGGAMYGGDEWVGLPTCNVQHALGYFKSGFCGQIPAFDTDRIVRYDASSLAYSWDEGRYHFVHSHYYPSYEMASVDYHSSLEWLERDLQTARDAGLSTILFVHAVQGLNQAMEDIILGKNVQAIIAGHTHRCLHRKCEGVYPLHEDQVENLETLGIIAEKCFPAAYDTCSVLNGENLIYAKDMGPDVTLPKKKLHNVLRKDKPLCPKPAPFYINETDNSLLCRRVVYSQPNFPFERDHNSTETAIPIFWSGSSSFQTFLQIHFFENRFVINTMAVASEEGEAARYVDLNTVPNAVYPYHEVQDMEETVIYLQSKNSN